MDFVTYAVLFTDDSNEESGDGVWLRRLLRQGDEGCMIPKKGTVVGSMDEGFSFAISHPNE